MALSNYLGSKIVVMTADRTWEGYLQSSSSTHIEIELKDSNKRRVIIMEPCTIRIL